MTVKQLGQSYLSEAKHDRATRWWAKPPVLEMNRDAAHHWIAYQSGHGNFHKYHERFNHAVRPYPCACGQTKTPQEIETCGLFRTTKKDMGPKDFVRRLTEQRQRALVVNTVAQALDWKGIFFFHGLEERAIEPQQEWTKGLL